MTAASANGVFMILPQGSVIDITDVVTQYAKKVTAGKIIACKSVRLACERHLRDLKKSKTKKYPYYFDAEEAERAFLFGIRFCRHSKGQWAGKPLELEDWQKFCVGNIFGWKRKDDGTRKYRYFYIQVARKNGKSTLMAFIGIYLLVCDGEAGAEVYSAATTRDQAKIIFEEAKRMVNASPELKSLVSVYRNNLSVDRTLSKFEPVSAQANTLDGLNVHGGLIDELHAHPSSAVYDVLESGTGARVQPLIGVGTTAGFNDQSFCHEKYAEYKNILMGTVENEDVFIYIAELDEGDDWTNPEVWIKANPNLGVSVYESSLQSACDAAKRLATAQNNFKCKRMNMWVTNVKSWANIECWNAVKHEIISPEQLLGMRCYVGCDLTMRNDLASVALEFPLPNGYYAVIHQSFIPEDKIDDNSRRDHYDYRAMVEKGYIIATEGNVVDFDYIEEYIRQAAERYKIVEVCIDPWNATQMMAHLVAEDFVVVETRMGYKTLSAPTKDLEYTIDRSKVIHFNDPVLRWGVGNVVVESDVNGNIRPNKEKASNKIDPAMALIIAHTRAYTDAENYVDMNSLVSEQLAALQDMMT